MINKSILIFVPILLILSGCTPSSLFSSPTQFLSPTITKPTITELTSSLSSSIVFDAQIELKGFSGVWSPKANEMVGITRPATTGEILTLAGTLTLASAPTFTLRALDEQNRDSVFENIIWSPDGQTILYGVTQLKGTLSVDYYSIPWKIGRDRSNPHPLLSGNHQRGFRGLEFLGWMDPQSVAYSGYMGGGHEIIEETDVIAGDILTSDIVHVSSHMPINSAYIPFVDYSFFGTTCVITQEVKTTSPDHACRSEQGSTRQFPRDGQIFSPDVETFFQDWLPRTNSILILAQSGIYNLGESTNVQSSRLLLWNVDTDEVSSLIPGGVFGRFSPDGRVLAFVTFGPSTQYPANTPHAISLDPVAIDREPYLQIMDARTGQNLLSLPVITKVNQSVSVLGITEAKDLSFSSDGGYMTFLTNGSVSLTKNQFPTEAILADASMIYLNILNLRSGQLVKSIKLYGLGKDNYVNLDNLPSEKRLVWSPLSDGFVFQDGTGKWQLFDLPSEQIIPIPIIGDEQFIDPSWSYNGEYLSFSNRYKFDDGIVRTYIIKLIGKP